MTSKVLAYRPSKSGTVEFLLDLLKAALVSHDDKYLVVRPEVFNEKWKRTRVQWDYLSNGDIRVYLAPAEEE